MKTTPSVSGTTRVRKDPRQTLLPWLGALGHTFFVIEPCDRPDNIYGGWRNCSENSCLKNALLDMKPGRQIWQKVRKRGKSGAAGETYRDVTP
jgi:hypothetical protein